MSGAVSTKTKSFGKTLYGISGLLLFGYIWYLTQTNATSGNKRASWCLLMGLIGGAWLCKWRK